MRKILADGTELNVGIKAPVSPPTLTINATDTTHSSRILKYIIIDMKRESGAWVRIGVVDSVEDTISVDTIQLIAGTGASISQGSGQLRLFEYSYKTYFAAGVKLNGTVYPEQLETNAGGISAKTITVNDDVVTLSTYLRESDSGGWHQYFFRATVYTDTTTVYEGNLNGTYQYIYTYYDKVHGIESAPSPLSRELTVSHRAIQVGIVSPPQDSNVTHYRLYRVGGEGSDYSLVHEIENTGLLPITYLDNILTSNLTDVCTTVGYRHGFDDSKFLVEQSGVFFTSVGSKVYYSKQGYPDLWNELFYLAYQDTITGLAKCSSGVIVFTANSTHLITFTTVDSISTTILSNEQGCKFPNSIAYLKHNVLWFSNDGLCSTSGGEVSLLSSAKLGRWTPSNVSSSTVHNEKYYATLPDHIWVADFSDGQAIKFYTLSGEGLTIANCSDRLFVMGNVYNAYGIYELFTGTDKELFTYKSGVLADNSLMSLKVYTKCRIAYKGTNFGLWVMNEDGVPVPNIDTLLLPDRDNRGVAEVLLPTNTTMYGIQFQVTGRGELYGISYDFDIRTTS